VSWADQNTVDAYDQGLFLIALPIVIIGGVIKLYNPLPKISNPYVSISDIELTPTVETKIYQFSDAPPLPRAGEPFERILRTKVLRVGYNTNTIPFFFKNNKHQFAGYDAAFAYQLAKDLGCSLEFVPMRFGYIPEEINAGYMILGCQNYPLQKIASKRCIFPILT